MVMMIIVFVSSMLLLKNFFFVGFFGFDQIQYTHTHKHREFITKIIPKRKNLRILFQESSSENEKKKEYSFIQGLSFFFQTK